MEKVPATSDFSKHNLNLNNISMKIFFGKSRTVEKFVGKADNFLVFFSKSDVEEIFPLADEDMIF